MTKKTKAVIVAFHKYQPYGGEFYKPLFDFFAKNINKYRKEFDHLYILDSTWNFKPEEYTQLSCNFSILQVNPHLRYYDAYKEILPQIAEDLVLFVDNDMVVYREGMIRDTFKLLEEGNEVVSIFDTIGEFQTERLNSKNKFCPYWFATGKEYLKGFTDFEWGPDMPKHETLGKLTEEMLKDGCISFEWEEDKSNFLFDGTSDGQKSKNLGYYHIRAGSTPAVLLAYKKHDPEKYWEYLKNQPKNEYLRQLAWYDHMALVTRNSAGIDGVIEMTRDLEIPLDIWADYLQKFRKYHGLR